jgi:hypothetical protein
VENVDFHAFHEHILAHVPSGTDVRKPNGDYAALAGAELDIYREAREIVEQLRCFDLDPKTWIDK